MKTPAMDMPFNDAWEEEMFPIDGGITSGLSSPVQSSPSSPSMGAAAASCSKDGNPGGLSPYPPSSSAFTSACIHAAMDGASSPISASPPASPSLVKRSLFCAGDAGHSHLLEAAVDGPMVVAAVGNLVLDYMDKEVSPALLEKSDGAARETEAGASKNSSGSGEGRESCAGAAKDEISAPSTLLVSAGGTRREAVTITPALPLSPKGAESMEVDDINCELVVPAPASGLLPAAVIAMAPPMLPVAVAPPVTHTSGVHQPPVAELTTAATSLSVEQQSLTPPVTNATAATPATATPTPVKKSQRIANRTGTSPVAATTNVTTAAAAATPAAVAVAVAAAAPAPANNKPGRRSGVSKAVPVRVSTDREDFRRYAAMTRDKLRQELKVRGLSVSGTKTDLYQRIVDHILGHENGGGVVPVSVGGAAVMATVPPVAGKGPAVAAQTRGRGRGRGRPSRGRKSAQKTRPGGPVINDEDEFKFDEHDEFDDEDDEVEDEDEDDEDVESAKGARRGGRGRKAAVLPVVGLSGSGPFSPFSPFAPTLPASSAFATTPALSGSGAALLDLDFNNSINDDEDPLDIPLEESLMEELRKQEEREHTTAAASGSVGLSHSGAGMMMNGIANGHMEEEDDDSLSSDASVSDDATSDDDIDDGLAAPHHRRHRGSSAGAHHRGGVRRRGRRPGSGRGRSLQQAAPHLDLDGETAMRRKENEEGLEEASKLSDIVLINDKIPRHLRTDDRYYYCKHCDRAWPKTSFRNAQQFGAHCSNCARRQVRRPSLPGKLGSPTSLSMGHLPRSSSPYSAAGGDGFFPPRTSSSAISLNGSGPKRALTRSQSIPLPLGRMKPENRGVFLWFDALPTDLIMRIFSFLQSSPRDLGAISSTCHFFSIIAAHDGIWRRMFETRWGTDLAARHVGTWRERFASRVAFLRAKASLPPSEPAAAGPEPVAEEEASRLKELWNGLLVDPKLKTRVVERVHSVSRASQTSTPSSSSSTTAATTAQQSQPPQDGSGDTPASPAPGSATAPATLMYLVQWASTDESDASAPEERQRWVTDEIMTAAPVIALPGCSSAVRKRRASDGAGGGSGTFKRLRRSLDDFSSSSSRKRRSLEDDSDDGGSSDNNDDDGMDGDDEDDNDEDDLSLLVGGGEDSNSSSLDATDPQQQHLFLSQRHLQQPQAAPQRKFEEGPQAKEARQRRQQLLREKEERARKRRRKGSGRAAAAEEANNNSNNNNDDVPLTKEDKERQQRDFLRVLYNNRDYKPVILFFDRNA